MNERQAATFDGDAVIWYTMYTDLAKLVFYFYVKTHSPYLRGDNGY